MIPVFRTLRANEIELRIGQKARDGKTKSILLYKDARVDMRLLDEVIKPMNWQREHLEISGVLYCKVSIWDDERKSWVSRMDAGEKSNIAADKGQASDAFKRACASWGIGRELYSAPKIWIPADINEQDLCVKHIAYSEDRQITELQISNKKTNAVVFSFGCGKSEAKQEARVNTQPKAEKASEAPKTANNAQLQFENLTPEEQNNYESAMVRMDFAISLDELYSIHKEFSNTRFAHLLAAHGARVKKERNW